MAGQERTDGATVLVIGNGPDGVPYRAWMRLNGITPPGRRRRRPPSRVCVRCGAREADGTPISLDHIVPQARLAHLPEIRNHPANHQWTCATETRPHARPDPRTGRATRWVQRYGCNQLKADGPAVDHRGDPDRYRQLVALLAAHDVDEPVAWDPRPYRGVAVPVPTLHSA